MDALRIASALLLAGGIGAAVVGWMTLDAWENAVADAAFVGGPRYVAEQRPDLATGALRYDTATYWIGGGLAAVVAGFVLRR